jgi:hypothetical protein
LSCWGEKGEANNRIGDVEEKDLVCCSQLYGTGGDRRWIGVLNWKIKNICGTFKQTEEGPNPSVAGHEMSGVQISWGGTSSQIQNPFLFSAMLDTCHFVDFLGLVLVTPRPSSSSSLLFSVFLLTLLKSPSTSRRSRGALSVRIRCLQAGCRNSGAIYSRLFPRVGERPLVFLNLWYGPGMAS